MNETIPQMSGPGDSGPDNNDDSRRSGGSGAVWILLTLSIAVGAFFAWQWWESPNQPSAAEQVASSLAPLEQQAADLRSGQQQISARIEEEISLLESEDEKVEFLDSLGLEETGLSQIIRAGYTLLNQITF